MIIKFKRKTKKPIKVTDLEKQIKNQQAIINNLQEAIDDIILNGEGVKLK